MQRLIEIKFPFEVRQTGDNCITIETVDNPESAKVLDNVIEQLARQWKLTEAQTEPLYEMIWSEVTKAALLSKIEVRMPR